MRRVAITGIGAVTPLGNDAKTTWEAVVAGQSGVEYIRAFDASAFPVQIAGEVKDFDPGGLTSAKELRRLDRTVLFALAAAKEALADAGVNGYAPDRVGVVVGGTEACIHPLILAGFVSMRGLAGANGDPAKASRPFDATREGFVMSEGAAVLVLEELEAAQSRGATIYAEVLGYGASNDAYHMAAPDPDSVGVVEMMRQALERAGVAAEEVDYVNAHGTSTPLGDLAETKALKEVFGDHAYELAVSSTKSELGHMFGAAGAVEAMMCALAIHHGVVPPTINYRNPDPDCDLDYVPNEAREADVRVALSNAMGLGGHNGCVLLGRVD